jgi:manganese transport protein
MTDILTDAETAGRAPAALASGPVTPARAAPRSPRLTWRMGGPAFVVAVAYIDPGNFATNMAAGARHGYQLLWVIALANVVAMFVQYLSAKLGLATGRSLPELCRQRWPRPMVWLMWAQAELVVMATDLAEFVGPCPPPGWPQPSARPCCWPRHRRAAAGSW